MQRWKAAAILWLIGWAFFGLPWTSFSSHPLLERVTSVTATRWADQLCNFVYYLPYGVIGSRLGWPSSTIVVTASALSGITEVAQIFSMDRFPSTTDLLLNTAGAIVGVALARFGRTAR